MKQYIKRFSTPADADDYVINDIPFISTVASSGLNITCNSARKKLLVSSGSVEVVSNVPPNDEIWYTSSEKISPHNYSSLPQISSHTYADGKGIIKFTENITSVGSDAFKECYDLISIKLPESVISIGDNAFYSCTHLISVDIPSNITTIGYNAFYDCMRLIKVTTPNITAEIGSGAFDGCYELKSINVSNTVSSIGSAAFFNCRSLTSITIPNSVTSIEINTFYACSGLTSVTIPNSVISIGMGAFDSCSSLTSMSVEAGNAIYDSRDNCNAIIETASNTLIAGCKNTIIPNSVTSIGRYAFSGCSGLTSVTIPNSITSIGSSAFAYCSSLTSVTIPNSVISIGNGAFSGCINLLSVTIPNSVTSIGGSAFNYVPNIVYSGSATGSPWGAKSVNGYIENNAIYSDSSKTTLNGVVGISGEFSIPSTVTTISSSAFYGCSELTSVVIPDNVTSISSGAFSNCPNLTTVEINSSSIAGNTYNESTNLISTFGRQVKTIIIGSGTTAIGAYACYNTQTLESITLPEGITSIGQGAFEGDTSIKTINIPDSVTSIGKYAFYNCRHVSFTIPNSVTSIGSSAFYNVPHITYSGSASGSPWGAKYANGYVDEHLVYSNSSKSQLVACLPSAPNDITIPGTVTSIGNSTFKLCDYLTSISIPSSVTSIGNLAFYNCSGLISVDIPNSVTSIGENAFTYCAKIKSLIIPNSVTTIGRGAFLVMDSLTDITLSENITSIPNSAFYNSGALTSIVIPNNVTNIGESAFSGNDSGTFCKSLTSVVMGNNVTTISQNAFYNCYNLSSITFSNSLTTIGKSAFYNCKALSGTEIPSTVTSIGSSAFGEIDNIVYHGSASGSPWGAAVINGYVDGEYMYSDSTKTTLVKCKTLDTSVTIPSTVTTIKNNCFSDCPGLTSVTIPNSITTIESNAFYYGYGYAYDYYTSVCPIQTFIVNGVTYTVDSLQSITVTLANGNSQDLYLWSSYCFMAGTKITLADGTTKAVEDIQYTDNIKVWNFDEGRYDSAYPLWIAQSETIDKYYKITLDDGTVLKASGANTGHKIYNVDEKKFQGIITIEEGTHVYTESGIRLIIRKETINEIVPYYNLMTDRHINCFAEGILTSMRYNSIYPFSDDMKFIKDNRQLRPYSEFEEAGISRYWYDGLRLAEQTDSLARIASYVKRLENKMVPKE